ncbi:MAG: S8 family serine peptidase, partial [Gaiella sp.]
MTRAVLALVLVVPALALAAIGGAAPPGGTTQVIVTLEAPPLAQARGARSVAAARIVLEQRRFAWALAARFPDARIGWRYSLVANGMSVVLHTSHASRLGALPGVRKVFPAVTYSASAGPDATAIRARSFSELPLERSGEGIKIGVIDDGLDQRHPFFEPSGYVMPPGYPKGQTAYTTAKVIVARAFPPPGTTWKNARLPFDPEESGHATHVAGIAAGNAGTAAQGGVRISGIAPRAYLGNYKALTVPTDAGVGLDGNAPELVAAIEAAVADGMDVINLSLGEPEIDASRDVVALALDAASDAGVVPVVAAGNDFDEFGAGSLSSPGSSAKAITVGAVSADASALAGFSAAGPTALSLRL